MGSSERCDEQYRILDKCEKCPYEGDIVPTALYGAEGKLYRGMRSAERRKANVLEMKCLRSLVGMSRIYRFGAWKSWNRKGVGE